MKITKRAVALFLCFALIFPLIPHSFAFSYADMMEELGIRGYEITTVAPGTQHIELSASNDAGNQTIHAVEFNPASTSVELAAGKSQGYVWSTQTVPVIANNMSNTNGGDVAVAAVNGDFFTFGVGVPHGIFIEDGIILSTPPQYYAAFGITYDNKPFITRHGTILDIEFRINGVLIPIGGINQAHTKDSPSLMLYTEEYARGTKTGTETYEVRCRINSGEVRHGGTINITVEGINDAVGNTSLGDGYVVLSAQGSRIDDLKKLSLGETHEISFRFNEFWSNVKFAVGGIELLLKDGEVYSNSDASKQPRTSIGIRADGTVVMATMDGRGAGGAAGMSYKQAAEAMRALGCVDALNLDGGGSTTFVLRTPGEMKAKTVNNISGNSERAVANALVLMNRAPTLDSPSTLVLTPKKRTVLKGGSYQFSVKSAYDDNYKPHPVPTDISWETDASPISENGLFYAENAGTFTVSAYSGNAGGKADIEVLGDVDSIKLSKTEITASAGESIELTASAIYKGSAVEGAQSLYEWSATEGLGSFTAPGKFTVAEDAIPGEITVRFGSAVATCKVEAISEPVNISGFERGGPTFNPVGVGTKTAPTAAYNRAKQYTHTGDRSLRISYDFTKDSETVGAYFTMYGNDESFYIKAKPKKLGMMVYGDGSGVSLNSILEDANGKQTSISFGKITHTGWKHMEAQLPSDMSGEFYIKAPVHIVSNPDKKTSGVLYFDNLRALYGAYTDDTTSPTVEKIWPDNELLIETATPSLGIVLSDESGIDESSIELYIDGIRCATPDFDVATGKLSYTVKNPLKKGFHSIALLVRDNCGNPVFKETVFEVL